MTGVLAVLSAPSNLGLRPPEPGSVPGTAKAPEALRATGLYERLQARDAGLVLPARYVDDDDRREAGRLRNHAAIVDYSTRLSQRIAEILDATEVPLVLGGDCSILLGAGLALRDRDDVGLLHLDGHTDFRHPGNSDACASLAGEDLAAAVGLHWPSIADINDGGAYFSAAKTAHLGCRDDDEYLAEAAAVIAAVLPARTLLESGPTATALSLKAAIGTTIYWLQVDVDILDPTYMPAVDSPDPGGISPTELIALLKELTPQAIGISITVFDPDLDPDGQHVALLGDLLTQALT